jgi:hypothetical protein
MDEIKQISIGSKTLSWSEDAVPKISKCRNSWTYTHTVARRKATRPNIGLEILGDRHIMVAKVLMEGMTMGGLSPDVIVATGSCTRKTVGG